MRILITGAGRAIGAATAAELSARGHHVVATARNIDALDSVEASERLVMDVRDAESVRSALEGAGELDAVVNNAAVTSRGPLEDYPIDLLTAVFDTNVLGPFRLLQAVIPSWRERGHGVIVNVSSIQGRVSPPLDGAYAASKHALEALSETMHYELSHFGIRTVIIEPGYTAPGMKSGGSHPGPPAYADLWEQWAGIDRKLNGPDGRPGPESVATAIADAIEDPTTPLRVPVGEDARLIFTTRRQLDDAEFEAALRATLSITW
jgi:NAD(P)-dependent dehydrogenase (short-subunit alcohol dehydrogenase family)